MTNKELLNELVKVAKSIEGDKYDMSEYRAGIMYTSGWLLSAISKGNEKTYQRLRKQFEEAVFED